MAVSLQQLSPVVVDLSPDIRHLLLRRYFDVVSRNAKLSLVLLAIVLTGLGHEAPLPFLVGLWAATGLLYWMRERLRRRALLELDQAAGVADFRPDGIALCPG